jgi:hypothetical protein
MRRIKGLIPAAVIMAFVCACSGSEDAPSSPPPDWEGKPLLTIAGAELGYGEAALLIYGAVEEYLMDYSIDWDGEIGGEPARRYFLQTALDMAVTVHATSLKAAELGIELTEEEMDEIDWYIAFEVDEAGGREAFLQSLDDRGLTEEQYRFYQYTVPYLSEIMLVGLYGEGGVYEPGDGELRMYYQTNYISASYIFRSGTDDFGEKLPDEDWALQKSIAEANHRDALRGEDFFRLVEEHGQHYMMAVNPEGMPIPLGDYGPAFDEALTALDVGEISDVVITDDGFYIILRLPEDWDWYEEYRDSLLYFYGSEMFEQMLDEWGKELDVVVSEAYWSLDPLEMVAVG